MHILFACLGISADGAFWIYRVIMAADNTRMVRDAARDIKSAAALLVVVAEAGGKSEIFFPT